MNWSELVHTGYIRTRRICFIIWMRSGCGVEIFRPRRPRNTRLQVSRHKFVFLEGQPSLRGFLL
jgi:hypothetical protein